VVGLGLPVLASSMICFFLSIDVFGGAFQNSGLVIFWSFFGSNP